MRHREGPAGRPAIPDDNAPVPPAHRPTRWTVRRVRSIAYVLVGLAVAASLVSVYLTYRSAESSAAQAAAVDKRLSVLEADLADRTRQRDAERDAASQEQERFRANLCVVLGELPASPGLDTIRATLHCTQPATPPTATRGVQPTPAPSATAGAAPTSTPAGAADTPAPPSAAPPVTPSPAAPPTNSSPLCGLLAVLC